MDSLLLIIKYLFKSKGIGNTDETIEEFFDNGTSFPQFVSLIFNKQIPHIINDPKEIVDKQSNNFNTFQYIINNNEEISKNRLSYQSENDKLNLLKLILTKQCFTLDIKQILNSCNIIVQSKYNIKFENESDLIAKHSLFYLLNVLTDESIVIPENFNNYDVLLEYNFEKANVPLVINLDSLKKENEYQYLIQIRIIENIFSQKIQDLTANFILNNEEEDYNESETEIDDTKKAIMKTINIVGSKGGFHFDNFYQAVENNSIPKFVMYFLKLSSIKNVDINNSHQNVKKNKFLTRDEIKNINAVITFLKKKKKKFEVLIFDFENPKKIEYSSILFYTTFLDLFFIKRKKSEVYERIRTILYTKRNGRGRRMA